ncbi:hypothetical protein HK096_002969, partial [Nowakowskiella sp. JEL0078]
MFSSGFQAELQSELELSTARVTLCEENEAVVQLSGTAADYTKIAEYLQNEQGVLFPQIVVPFEFAVFDGHSRRVLQTAILKPTHANDPNLAVSSTFKNVHDLLLTISERFDPAQKFIDQTLSVVSSTYKTLEEISSAFISWFREVSHSAVTQYKSHLEITSTSPIRALAWHHYKQIFAIAHRLNTVHIFDLTTAAWFPKPLIHKFQQDITCIEFHPQSGSTIAVGCRQGVCIWKVGLENSEIKAFANSAWMTFLTQPSFENVSCISWSPDGKYLAVGSATTSAILIWDVALEICTPLRSGLGTGSWDMKWSPDGNYLSQFCLSNHVRIWESQSWSVRTLILKGKPHSPAWMPDSKMLIYGFQGQSKVSGLQMNATFPELVTADLQGADLDLNLAIESNGIKQRVTGPISKIELDPSGNRLAVMFGPLREAKDKLTTEDENNLDEAFIVHTDYVLAMYKVTVKPWPKYDLSGIIEGPQWNANLSKPHPPRSPFHNSETPNLEKNPDPKIFTFANQFDRGALLSVCWDNGKIGFIP